MASGASDGPRAIELRAHIGRAATRLDPRHYAAAPERPAELAIDLVRGVRELRAGAPDDVGVQHRRVLIVRYSRTVPPAPAPGQIIVS